MIDNDKTVKSKMKVMPSCLKNELNRLPKMFLTILYFAVILGSLCEWGCLNMWAISTFKASFLYLKPHPYPKMILR